MKLRLVAIAAAVAALVPATAARGATRWQGSFTKHTQPAGAGYPARDYWLYVPPTLPPSGQRALVVFLHGCTQTGDDAARSVRWNDLADQRGFVVAYPEQHAPSGLETDGSAARCWNTGQVLFPKGQGELESIAQITRAVTSSEGIDPARVYVVGISAGALMVNVLVPTYPELYRGAGSVEGCAYLCSDATGQLAYQRMGSGARVIPAFVVQGTADYLTNPAMGEITITQWLGTDDLADDGTRNGSVSPVPASVENRDVDSLGRVGSGSGDACLHDFPRNPCPVAATGVTPYPSTVRHYDDKAGHEVVQAWLIHGLSHNSPGGTFEGSFGDPYAPDMAPVMFDYFESNRGGGNAAAAVRRTAKGRKPAHRQARRRRR